MGLKTSTVVVSKSPLGIPVHNPVQVQRTDGEGVQDLQGQFSQEVRASQTSPVSYCLTVCSLYHFHFVYTVFSMKMDNLNNASVRIRIIFRSLGNAFLNFFRIWMRVKIRIRIQLYKIKTTLN